MIRLKRLGLSDTQTQRLKQREQRLAELLASGVNPPKSLLGGYSDPDVKDVLRRETYDKCAYCESRVTHTYPGDVEHIIPKTTSVSDRFDYHNLTFACWQCNNNKRDYHDPQLPLLNPFVDDPETELTALGPMIWDAPGRLRGRVTRMLLDLNRAALLERREERLEAICSLVDAARALPAGGERMALEREICREIADDSEFAFITRAYVQREMPVDCT